MNSETRNILFAQAQAWTQRTLGKKDYIEEEELEEKDLDVYSESGDEDFEGTNFERGFMKGYLAAAESY